MGRRSRIKKYQVLTDADSSTNPLSAETDISGVDFVIYQIETDVSVDAILNVYFGNSEVFNSNEIEKLNFGQVTSLIGATDNKYMVVIENKGFKWMLIEVENNGGTGNVSAWISGTVRGA